MSTEDLENKTPDKKSDENNSDATPENKNIFTGEDTSEDSKSNTNIFNGNDNEGEKDQDEGPIEIKLGDTSFQLDVKGIQKDSAQKIADQLASKIAEAAKANNDALQNTLYEQSLADKEIGGESFKETSRLALKAVKALGTPELKQLLTGPVGSHPEVLRFLSRVGKAISEDGFVADNGIKKETREEIIKASVS